MRRNRNNRAIDLYRDGDTYVLNLFVEFGFLITLICNMYCFLPWSEKQKTLHYILPYIGDFSHAEKKKLRYICERFCKDIDINIAFEH